ncbi:MAG: carbohydrate ABC transporter permease [Provencibacterium sp.]|nr:carbohydrate ABC transporter permease [Provencibacterium sp.]
MVEKRTAGDHIFDTFNVLLLSLFSILFLYPMVHVVMASFSEPRQIMNHVGILLWPDGFSLEGYKVVLGNPNILNGYLNTIFYVVAGTALNILLSSMGAYVLSSKEFPMKRTISIAIVFTMYFSGGMIPNFLLVRGLGMYNSRLAMLLPAAINTWNLIMMRTSFAAIPDSLAESARIDGANDFTILFRIIFPVAKATIAVMVLFYAVGHWNSWFNAMIYLQDREKYPLQLILREILISNSSSGNTVEAADEITNFLGQLIKYCTIVVSTLPVLCIYPFVQKYFMTGVMVGAIKE